MMVNNSNDAAVTEDRGKYIVLDAPQGSRRGQHPGVRLIAVTHPRAQAIGVTLLMTIYVKDTNRRRRTIARNFETLQSGRFTMPSRSTRQQ
jgi:hypothetical protein